MRQRFDHVKGHDIGREMKIVKKIVKNPVPKETRPKSAAVKKPVVEKVQNHVKGH